MKLSIEVGETEKHFVEFSWNQFIGKTKIKVNRDILVKSGWQITSPNQPAEKEKKTTEEKWVVWGKEIVLVEEWSVNIGEKEKHKVKFKKTRPKWFAGFRPHTYEIFVDDKFIREQTGF